MLMRTLLKMASLRECAIKRPRNFLGTLQACMKGVPSIYFLTEILGADQGQG